MFNTRYYTEISNTLTSDSKDIQFEFVDQLPFPDSPTNQP